MEGYYLDWVNLLLRWAHIIAAIAWIGASFYFVMLDNSLEKPRDQESLDKGSAASNGRCMAAASTTCRNTRCSPSGCPSICTGRSGKATAPG